MGKIGELSDREKKKCDEIVKQYWNKELSKRLIKMDAEYGHGRMLVSLLDSYEDILVETIGESNFESLFKDLRRGMEEIPDDKRLQTTDPDVGNLFVSYCLAWLEDTCEFDYIKDVSSKTPSKANKKCACCGRNFNPQMVPYWAVHPDRNLESLKICKKCYTKVKSTYVYAEEMYPGIKGYYLFSMDGDVCGCITEDLSNGNIHTELQKGFDEEGHKLSNQSSVTVIEENNGWKINDQGNIYTVENGMNKLNVYIKHLEKSKKQMIEDLKNLIVLLGFIPYTSFPNTKEFMYKIPEENEVEIINLLKHMAPGKAYIDKFDSFFKAVAKTGLLEEDARKTGFGTQILAEDGHVCLSLAEQYIDNWLFRNNIPHTKEPHYPDESLRADWKVGEYFIEYWGLKGQEEYDKKINLKRKIAHKNEIPLVELSQKDLPNLDVKLDILKEEYS